MCKWTCFSPFLKKTVYRVSLELFEEPPFFENREYILLFLDYAESVRFLKLSLTSSE